MAMLVGSVWALYGFLIGDSYVFLPSLWGVFVATTQLVVYLWINDVINFKELYSRILHLS